MRLLQLSDPHLLAESDGIYRGRRPYQYLAHGLTQALAALDTAPDLLLLSGDLCQDETLAGYRQLRQLLEPLGLPLGLLPGNHDHPQLLRAALGRLAFTPPALVSSERGNVLLLDSHQAGATAGRLGASQLDWLASSLRHLKASSMRRPLLVAVHHPPVPIGDPVMDAIGLEDAAALLELLRPAADLVAVVFGHVHQHWAGLLPGRPDVALLGCPSSLCPFGPVQLCPLGRPDDPGGRWLELDPGFGLRQSLLRWQPP